MIHTLVMNSRLLINMKIDIFLLNESILTSITLNSQRILLLVNNMQFEWIFFDLGNTLYDENNSDYERIVFLIERCKCDISPDDFLKQMKCGATSFKLRIRFRLGRRFCLTINQFYNFQYKS